MTSEDLQLTIRDAIPTEAQSLSDLAGRSKSHWPYDAAFLDLCRSVTHVTAKNIEEWHYRVAEQNCRVLGFAAVCAIKNEYMLDHLWIEPASIRTGIGRKLFEDAILIARRMGWTKFTIAADPYAEEFYLKLGARRIGQRESKIKPGLFLPLLEFDLGLILIGDQKVKSVLVSECHEDLVDLAQAFPELQFDWERCHVQKKSKKISLARKSVGERLTHAQSLLPKGLHLLVKECHRPMNIQQEFWEGYHSHLKNKFPHWPEERVYAECSKLAAPLDVAPHTTGGAVDLTLTNEQGVPLEMGTQFNAEPLETANATFTTSPDISTEAHRNRQILMSAMSKAGFVNYPTEWWHWSYGDKYWALQTSSPCAIYGSVEEF